MKNNPVVTHQLRIARDTLFKYSPLGVAILGGMTRAEAARVIRQYGTRADVNRLNKLEVK